MKNDNKNDIGLLYKLGGWSVILCFIITIVGLILTIVSILDDTADLTTAGICLIAPAIAMGLIANGLTRR